MHLQCIHVLRGHRHVKRVLPEAVECVLVTSMLDQDIANLVLCCLRRQDERRVGVAILVER